MPTAEKDRPAYEAREPKFLASLRREAAGGGFEERDRPRTNRRIVTRIEDEEEGPTYVDEESNDIVSKAEYEALVAGEADDAGGGSGKIGIAGDASGDKSTTSSKDPKVSERTHQATEAGVNQRKRKAVKVGADDEKDAEEDSPRDRDKTKKKPKKKLKPVGLSFDQD